MMTASYDCPDCNSRPPPQGFVPSVIGRGGTPARPGKTPRAYSVFLLQLILSIVSYGMQSSVLRNAYPPRVLPPFGLATSPRIVSGEVGRRKHAQGLTVSRTDVPPVPELGMASVV